MSRVARRAADGLGAVSVALCLLATVSMPPAAAARAATGPSEPDASAPLSMWVW